MKKSCTKTTLTNALPINNTAKILGLRLGTKLDSQRSIDDRWLVAKPDPIPPYDDPLY